MEGCSCICWFIFMCLLVWEYNGEQYSLVWWYIMLQTSARIAMSVGADEAWFETGLVAAAKPYSIDYSGRTVFLSVLCEKKYALPDIIKICSFSKRALLTWCNDINVNRKYGYDKRIQSSNRGDLCFFFFFSLWVLVSNGNFKADFQCTKIHGRLLSISALGQFPAE